MDSRKPGHLAFAMLGSLATVPLLAGLLGSCGPGASEPASDARQSAEFGDVFEGSILEHEFLLEIAKNAPVTVEAVRSDCGCTVASLEVSGPADLPRRTYVEGTVLAPGSRLHVKVRYDTRGRIGDAARTISVYANPLGKVEVALRANVKRWLVAEPDRLDLLPLDENGTQELALEVRSTTGEAFLLEATRHAIPEEVRVELAPRGASGLDQRSSAWTARVLLGPGLPRGLHAWPIELVSDVPVPRATGVDSLERTFSVSPLITVQIVGALELTPPTLSFGALRGDEVVSRSVRLRCLEKGTHLEEPRARLVPLHEGDDFRLARTAEIHVRRVAGEEAWDVEVVLSGLDDGVQGTLLARLVIETSHPRDPLFEVPVTGFRLRSGALSGEGDPGTQGRLVGLPKEN